MSLSFFLVLSYFLEQIVPGLPSNFSASDQKSIVFFSKDPMFLLVVNGMETSIWAFGVLISTRMVLYLGPFSGQI